MNTSQRIKWARSLFAPTLSQRELSRLAGLSPACVRLVEIRQDGGTEAVTIAAIARTLGVTVDWLANGTGKQPGEEQIRRAVSRARASQSKAA